MTTTSDQLKELRGETGISVMQCKKALDEAGGDMDKARIILKKQGSDASAKKSDRSLGAGTVAAYVHATHEVAAMVNLSSETDFVAKNDEFIALARDIAMHVAAQAPKFISREEVDETARQKAKEVFIKEVKDKPEDLQEKILEGKLDAYFKEMILLEQPFIKDSEHTIADLVNNAVQKFGEKIVITEISRISIK